MEIRLLHLLDGARRATGFAVVIDVFRAFSTACYVAAQGARRILAVDRPQTAYRLRTGRSDRPVLVGEEGGRKIAGFDHGNSPSEILEGHLRGRTVIQRTSAGTRGLAWARNAEAIVTGSFVNADAIRRYLQARRPSTVSLVCMGWQGERRTLEDDLCGEYLAAALAGEALDFEPLRAAIRASPAARKFGDPARPWFPAADLELCLELDRFDFVLEGRRLAEDVVELRPRPAIPAVCV